MSPEIQLDLEKFVMAAPMPIVIADVRDDFRFVIANRHYERFVMRKAHGLKMRDIFPLEEVAMNQKIFETYEGVARTKKATVMHAWPLKLFNKKKKVYETLFYDTYTYPVINEKKQVTYLVTIIMDVTRATENVESLRVEKELRDTFLTGLGHDLTQPLSIAKMSALKIQELFPGDGQISRLTRATVHGLERIEVVFQTLLDAYYLDATKGASLKLSKFSPQDVTRSLLEVMSFAHGERFALKTKGEIKVLWDREGYMRILENYLSNAVKYSEAGSRITVGLEEFKTNVRLTVHNKGPAISLDEQGRLFRMFQKGSVGKGLKGWGLGLAIVRGIAEAHGGVSGVISQKKTGTKFFVVLPKKAKLS